MTRLISTFFCLLTLLGLPSFAFAYETTARSAYVIDVNTGAVLLDKNSEQSLPPASMSKLMTVEIVFDKLQKGELQLDNEFFVSEKAWSMGGSKMFVDVNSSVTIDELLYGIIVQSGNDACVVVAEGIGGTEANFAQIMNERAAKLGLEDSHFANASGWPDPNQRMSAQDLAKLAYHLTTQYPEFAQYFTAPSYEYHGISQNNRNPLIGVVDGAYGYKTGHTEEAGYGLVGGVERGDRNVVFVMMGLDSQDERTEQSRQLAQWAIDSFESREVFAANTTILEIPTWLGAQKTIKANVTDAIKILQPKGRTELPKMRVEYTKPLKAPIAQGQKIGDLIIAAAPPLAEQVIPLHAAEAVERGGFFQRYIETVQYLVNYPFAN